MNMNWGTKVMIGMGLFMAFILAMSVKMFMVAGEDELVDKNYYEKGLAYDQDYNLQKEAIADSVVPVFTADHNGLSILFSAAAQYKLVCKRPSDAKLDRVFSGEADENFIFTLPKEEFIPGPWQFHLEFTINGKQYLVEREMMML